MSESISTLCTHTREDAKLVLANLPASIQAHSDVVFAAAQDYAAAAGKADAAKDKAARRIGIALSLIGKEADALKNAGFKTFSDFTSRVFGMDAAAAQASQWKRVADLFLTVDKPPACAQWYSVSKLHELRSVSIARLDADVESGALTAGMTQSELRKYANMVKEETATPTVVQFIDGYIKIFDETGVNGTTVRTVPFDGNVIDDVPSVVNAAVSLAMGREGIKVTLAAVSTDAQHVDDKGNKSKVIAKAGRFVGGWVVAEYWKRPKPKAAPAPANWEDAVSRMTDEEKAALAKLLGK